jgi:Tol biopolymer transport system component
VHARRADGTGATQELVTSSLNFGQALQSRDSAWLVLRRAGNEAGSGDIYAVRTGDTALKMLVGTPAAEGNPALSPDGRWLAYSSDESGASEVYVRPFPDAASARWQVSTTGGSEPIWANSGRELFYRSGKNEIMAAEIPAGPTFVVGSQRALFSAAPYLSLGFFPSYSVSPDDRRFLMIREGSSPQISELILAENWLEELTTRAPR